MDISALGLSSSHLDSLFGNSRQNRSSASHEATRSSSDDRDSVKISQRAMMMSLMSGTSGSEEIHMPDADSMTNDEFRDMLSSMRDKLKEQGIDVSTMKDPSELSDAEIEDMKAKMQQIQEKMSGMLPSEPPDMGDMSGGAVSSNSISGLQSTSEDDEEDTTAKLLNAFLKALEEKKEQEKEVHESKVNQRIQNQQNNALYQQALSAYDKYWDLYDEQEYA